MICVHAKSVTIVTLSSPSHRPTLHYQDAAICDKTKIKNSNELTFSLTSSGLWNAQLATSTDSSTEGHLLSITWPVHQFTNHIKFGGFWHNIVMAKKRWYLICFYHLSLFLFRQWVDFAYIFIIWYLYISLPFAALTMTFCKISSVIKAARGNLLWKHHYYHEDIKIIYYTVHKIYALKWLVQSSTANLILLANSNIPYNFKSKKKKKKNPVGGGVSHLSIWNSEGFKRSNWMLFAHWP